MAYNFIKKTWVNGEVIYEVDLNRIEEGIVEALREAAISISKANAAQEAANGMGTHLKDKQNPHGVTAAQVGAATSEALTAHTNDKKNPHGVTAAQVGAAPSTHKHAASDIEAGTFAATGVCAMTGTDYDTARIRNTQASTTDMTAGSSTLSSGNIHLVYE